MFNICPNCGQYRPDKEIVPDEGESAYAVCPECNHQHKFLRLPLFLLAGASGSGKSTVALELTAQVKDVVVLESDILWRAEFNTPEDDYREYRETWLRMCKNISQSGKPVVLAGAAVPEVTERSIERRYFSTVHYLALVCDDDTLAARLRARPSWRGFVDDATIDPHLSYNRWLKANGQHPTYPITLLDTSKLSVGQSVSGVENWIQGHLAVRHR